MFAVWIPAQPGDSRSDWNPTIFDDRRVVNLWDGKRVVGTWLGNPSHVGIDARPFFWDGYVLFGPKARWKRTPGRPVSSGQTVLGTTDRLKRDLARLLHF